MTKVSRIHAQYIRLMNTSHIHHDIEMFLVVLPNAMHIAHSFIARTHQVWHFIIVISVEKEKKSQMNRDRNDTLKIRSEWVSNCIRFTALILMDFLYIQIRFFRAHSAQHNTEHAYTRTQWTWAKFIFYHWAPVCKQTAHAYTDSCACAQKTVRN